MQAAFQQRVVEELADLSGKIERLNAFFGTAVCEALPREEHQRLALQINLMTGYAMVLKQRIEAFEEEETD